MKTFLMNRLPNLFNLLFPKSPNRILTIEELRDPVRVAYRKSVVREHQANCTRPFCPFCITDY